MTLTRWDIAVVGGGVVGLAAVRALRVAGFEAGVIEQGAPPLARADDARVYAIAGGQAPLFPAAVWRDPALQPFETMRVWHHDPAQSLRFDRDLVRAEQLGWIAPESVLRAALWSEIPAMACLPHAGIAEVTPHEDGVSLMLESDQVIRAGLVLACDGAASPLRERAGVAVHQWRYAQQAVVAAVRTEQAHQRTCWQRFADGEVIALLPLADGRCSLVWSTPAADELAALPDDAFCDRLSEATQWVLGKVSSVGPRQRFPLVGAQADRYVAGRLVLLGDAAHSVHPLAGQGVNLGLRDVATLVEVLSSARDRGIDWTAPRVLARYQRARRAESAEMIAITDGLARGFSGKLPLLSDMLEAGMRWVDQAATLKAALIRRAMGL